MSLDARSGPRMPPLLPAGLGVLKPTVRSQRLTNSHWLQKTPSAPARRSPEAKPATWWIASHHRGLIGPNVKKGPRPAEHQPGTYD
jgi:hypothetical protein